MIFGFFASSELHSLQLVYKSPPFCIHYAHLPTSLSSTICKLGRLHALATNQYPITTVVGLSPGRQALIFTRTGPTTINRRPTTSAAARLFLHLVLSLGLSFQSSAFFCNFSCTTNPSRHSVELFECPSITEYLARVAPTRKGLCAIETDRQQSAKSLQQSTDTAQHLAPV